MVGTGRTMGYGAAVARLAEAQKTAKGVSLYSRYVNRPVGRRLAAAAYRLGLSPDQVTLLSAVVSGLALAGVALAPPSWALGAAVWFGLFLGFALDSADGQLARLLGVSSPAGEWLDHVVDLARITALHAVVLIAFHRFFELPGDGWLLLPLGFQLAHLLIFFGGLLTDQLRRSAAGRPAPPAAVSRVRAVALLPVDFGTLCLVFLLLGDERAFRFGYAALAVAYGLFFLAFSARWFRALSALNASRAPRS
ncbi:CDP-alcohol phosphatidyltransferase family protein [Streptomyces sp. DSM 44915]|uniref:CDP-alcohol phosphatidyltransferase family protein n=1 Tax=Streptomyces chisholmiae TaxID=3075540 RepID=A0ABU2JIP2_9ACTN|nr:CDP-alcohol phosphatidyltransferase family protein [Streptomyces sp. DSM 44915]MDT0264787.1 CDP-alcohol phosphatidyltransferase family protein [Streptomyces sp. DSM 44915]